MNSTDIVIQFHDPEHYLKSATRIQYFWFIDDVAYGQTNQVPALIPLTLSPNFGHFDLTSDIF